MRFSLQHTIAAPLDAVEAALLDPTRLPRLPAVSPVLRQAEVTKLDERGGEIERVARFEAGNLRALVGP
jgi:hypothetical protein